MQPSPLRLARAVPIELTPLHAASARSASGVFAYFRVLQHSVRLVLLGLLALVLIGLAAGVGAVSPRWIEIYEAGWRDGALIERMLDAVLRQEPPLLVVSNFALLAAFVTAYALFPVILRDGEGRDNLMRRLLRIVAGMIIVVAANMLFFEVFILDSERLSRSFAQLMEFPISRQIIEAQASAVAATAVLAVLYQIITRRPPSPPQYPLLLNFLRVVAGLVRCVVVFYAIIRVIVSLSALQLGMQFNLTSSLFPLKPSNPTDEEARILMIALFALALGVLLYHVPHYRVKMRFSAVVRVVTCLALLGAAALIYAQVNTTMLVEAAALGGTLAVIFAPVQHAYS